ncbi:zinc-binding protein [Pseudomonas putida]|nr:zinc-binding protein [Pseudomonas putida]
MRRLLLALPFALLPLAVAQAHDDDHDHDHAHGTLGAHEHGVAKLNAVLDGNTLELELDSPAMNLVGFEHAANSEADKAKVAAVRQQLEQPLKLFGLPAAAGCKEDQQELESPLFGDAPKADDDDDKHEHQQQHSDIGAHYQLTCANPDKLTQVDLAPLFKAFPATEKINVQLIGPNGQKGVETTPAKAAVAF